MDINNVIETCKQVPFTDGLQYCYGPVWLSEGDKVFIVLVVSALLGILANVLHDGGSSK